MSNIDDLKKYSLKRTGVDLIKVGSDKPQPTYLSTGVWLLDFALLGGIQENTVSTIVGQKHSGKTTLTHKITGEFQRKYDGVANPKLHAACIELENAYDAPWAGKNGVNTDELILVQPFDGESAVDLACEILENDDIGLLVLDSIPNLVPMKEIGKSAEDMVIAPVATLAQRMLRKMSTIMAKANAQGKKKTVLLINQWREKAGVSFGDPRSLPGGKFIRYYSSMELEIYNRKEAIEKDSDDIDSVSYNEHSFKIMKNRAGNSIREGEFVMARRTEDDHKEGDILDNDVVVTYAQKFGFIEGAGPKWSLTHPYTGEILDFKGKKYIAEKLAGDDELRNAFKRKLISMQRSKQGMSENF